MYRRAFVSLTPTPNRRKQSPRHPSTRGARRGPLWARNGKSGPCSHPIIQPEQIKHMIIGFGIYVLACLGVSCTIGLATRLGERRIARMRAHASPAATCQGTAAHHSDSEPFPRQIQSHSKVKPMMQVTMRSAVVTHRLNTHRSTALSARSSCVTATVSHGGQSDLPSAAAALSALVSMPACLSQAGPHRRARLAADRLL